MKLAKRIGATPCVKCWVAVAATPPPPPKETNGAVNEMTFSMIKAEANKTTSEAICALDCFLPIMR